MTPQCFLVAKAAKQALAGFRKRVISRQREGIIPFCLALLRLHVVVFPSARAVHMWEIFKISLVKTFPLSFLSFCWSKLSEVPQALRSVSLTDFQLDVLLRMLR